MESKECGKCKSVKPLTDFHRDKTRKDGYNYGCKDCLKAKNRKNGEKARNRNYGYIIEYLEKHPCSHCGEKDILVLEFNHLGDKRKNVSELINKAYSLRRIKEEIDKCEVLCANCHKRYTAKQQQNFKWKHLN